MKKPMKFNALFGSLLLASSLVLVSCGKGCGSDADKPGAGAEATKGAESNKEAFELIPNSSTMVLTMDWKKILASPLGAEIKAKLPPEVAPHVDNIENIVMGFKFTAQQKPEEPIAIVTGKLDQAKILGEINKAKPATVEEYEGVKIHSNPDTKDESVAFLGDRLIFGNKESVKKSIDLSKGKGDSIKKNEELMQRINQYGGGKMFAAGGIWPEGMGGAPGAGGPFGDMPKIKSFDMAVDYVDALNANMGFALPTPEEAQKSSEQLNAAKVMMGPAMGEKNPAIKKVIDGLNVKASGNRVELALNVDKATVEELKKMAAEGPGAPTAPGPVEAPAPAGAPTSAAPAPAPATN